MHKNVYLLVETIIIFIANAVLANYLYATLYQQSIFWICYIPLLLFQGLWFYRIYIVGHETAHKKLFPKNLKLNDAAGTITLLPLLVPINVYRKIHYFHHGFNRKDEHTSALDTFVISGKNKKIKTIYYYIIWYLSVFFGGFFLHSLVSVILFLFCPPQLAVKISPAFKGWSFKDQGKAILLFAIGVGIHILVYYLFGKTTYLLSLGFPLLSFAWVLSIMVYIFHYDTSMGDQVRYNVRSVKKVPILSWILMNFNEHATHHQYPNIPWYDLPIKRTALPSDFEIKNQNTYSYFKAIFNQLKGPHIVYKD